MVVRNANNHIDEQSIEQSIDQSIDLDQFDDDHSNVSNTLTYAVWSSPSSPFVRVFIILLIWSFVLSMICSLAQRIVCVIAPSGDWLWPPTGFRGHLILNITLVLTWLLPSDFISLFVWHFAFDALSNVDATRRYIDFSTTSGIKAFFVDLKSCTGCRMPCCAARMKSSKHDESSDSNSKDGQTINQPINRHVKADMECKSELLLYGPQPIDQSFAMRDHSDHRLHNETPETVDDPDLKLNNQHNALLNIDTHVDQSNYHLMRRSKIQSIKQSITDTVTGRTRWRVQPLHWFTTPSSIYGVIWRNHLINWLTSLVYATPWNLGGFLFANTGWLGVLVQQVFGAAPTQMLPFASAIQLANEYLLLPMFYRKQIHSLRISPAKRRRSIIIFSIVPLFILLSQFFDQNARGNSGSCFFWCTVFPRFTKFMTTPLMSQKWDLVLIIFVALSLLLLVDEMFHFGGSQSGDHRDCPCRWSYLLVLILLVSQSAGFMTVARDTFDFFSDWRQIYLYTELQMFVSVHLLLVWWQLLVTSVARKALHDSFADAIVFPVLLLDDFVSSLFFLATPPFSVMFFVTCLAQAGKAVIRDLSFVSRCYELIIGVVRRALRLRVAVCSMDDIRRKQLSRRIVRYQSFMVEICGKLVIIGALLLDVIPLYQDAPVLWTTVSRMHSIESAENSLEMMSALFVMLLTHCFVHFVLMKVVDWLDRKELGHDPTPNCQAFNAHWQRCFLFWFACLTKLVPLTIFLFGANHASVPLNVTDLYDVACNLPAIGIYARSLASLGS